MGRINGRFNYKPIGNAQIDPETGFYLSVSPEWVEGCECQIEKFVPARKLSGEDGQKFAYTYDIFIPKYAQVELMIGTQIQLQSFDGVTDEFTIKGIDDLNRKYVEVWG